MMTFLQAAVFLLQVVQPECAVDSQGPQFRLEQALGQQAQPAEAAQAAEELTRLVRSFERAFSHFGSPGGPGDGRTAAERLTGTWLVPR